MNNKWDGYKNVTELSQDEMDELKCNIFDTNVPDEYTNEDLFEVADGISYTCEDFQCNCG